MKQPHAFFRSVRYGISPLLGVLQRVAYSDPPGGVSEWGTW